MIRGCSPPPGLPNNVAAAFAEAMTRNRIIGLAAAALTAVLLAAHPAQGATAATPAGDPGRPDFTAASRAAGLTAAQADALQAKADGYLARLDEPATQVAPDLIELNGADLHLAVPGMTQRAPGCPYYYFCAYSGERFTGDWILIEECWEERFIPWSSTGSWINNQTRGTQPLLEFTNAALWWMPGAYAQQATGVGWSPVFSITACFH